MSLRQRTRRRGSATVEFAFALPVLLVFVFGLIEYGRAQMVSNLIRTATRQASRYGALEGVTTAQAKARVQDLLTTTVAASSITVSVKDASSCEDGDFPSSSSEFNSLGDLELSNAEPQQLFVIRATVNYGSVSLLNLPYFQGLTLSGESFMRHE
jgi:Flp pilus assembly protein TadG